MVLGNIYISVVNGGYKSINQFIVNGGRYTQMRTMVLEYIYQHLHQKWPSFVGKYTVSPWFAFGNGVRSLSWPVGIFAVPGFVHLE